MALFQRDIYDVYPCQNISNVGNSGWEQSPIDRQIICIYFKENDYLQAFIIALFLIYIHMGTYFMQYPLHAGFYYNLISFKLKCNIDDIKHEWKNREKLKNQPGYVGGVPVLFYFIVTAILHIIYIVIKISLVASADIDPNSNFYKESFSDFNSGLRIIGMGFFIHSVISALINIGLLYHSNFNRKCGTCLSYSIGFIYISDIIVSIVTLSIHWSILLVGIYQIGCILLVFIGCIILSCIIIPILYLYIYGIVSLSSCFGCLCSKFNESKPMYIFSITVGGGLASLSILYLCLTASIGLSFLFLNGPPGAALIIDFNRGSQDSVFISLVVTAFFIGVGGIIVSFISSFLRTNIKTRNAKPSVFKQQSTKMELNIEMEYGCDELNLMANGVKSKSNSNDIIHIKPESSSLMPVESVLNSETI